MGRNPHEPRRREHFIARHYKTISACTTAIFVLGAVFAVLDNKPGVVAIDLTAAALWLGIIWLPWRPGGASRVRYDRWMERHPELE